VFLSKRLHGFKSDDILVKMAEAMADAKPVCGSEKENGEYDLPLHVIALFLVLAFSIFGKTTSRAGLLLWPVLTCAV